jgi:pimeloyl-ACP methyl ester carboxylesterase
VLANIKVPTLILWGEADPLITVPAAHKFNAAIKGSELKIYPGVGHLPMTEIPEQSATDAAAFLARHPQP